jgi:DNA-binding response OmpR family regulator
MNLSQRILVVEDEPAIRQFNAQVLARSGYQVDAAEDGAAGWEALHANHFDLLLTDHDMPRLSGLDLVKKVRAARMTLPVILATGALPEEELKRHPWLQLAATLLKPFSPHQLVETVKKVLFYHHGSSALVGAREQSSSTFHARLSSGHRNTPRKLC